MANSYFSLDIGEKFTKIAEINQFNNDYEINFLGKGETDKLFYTSENEKNINLQAELISKLVANLEITKKNVNIVIPDSFSYSQVILMPYLNEKELISAIKYQADQFIPMPIEETNIDLEIIEEYKEEKKILILIAAAPKKLIEKIQTTVELAGLIPDSIELEVSANARFIFNFFKKNPQKNSENFLLINFSSNSSNVSYFEKNPPIIKETHNLSIGYQLILKEIMINGDIDEIKAIELLKNYNKDSQLAFDLEKIIGPIIRELSNQIKKIIINKKINSIYIINEIFLFPGLCYFLEKQLSIPISIINPADFFKKTTLVENIKNELPLFVSTFGANLI